MGRHATPSRMNLARRILAGGLLCAFILTLVGLLTLWPRGEAPEPKAGLKESQSMAAEAVAAEVLATYPSACGFEGVGKAFDANRSPAVAPGEECTTAVIRIGAGADEGRETVLQNIGADKGEKILLAVNGETYSFLDIQRSTPMFFWLAITAVAIIVVGALRGARALFGVAFTFGVIGFFLVPALLRGGPPVALAVLSGAAIMFPVMFFVHGVNWKSASALAGTLSALVLAAGGTHVMINSTHVRGLGDESNLLIQLYVPSVSVLGLMLAGFIIGALGALNDATVAQASTVAELSEATPTSSTFELFSSAMRVGRDHIASMVYTLVLAYIGAALPMTLLLTVVDRPLTQILTSDVVATELLRSAVGALGLVIAVPLTTIIAAATVRD